MEQEAQGSDVAGDWATLSQDHGGYGFSGARSWDSPRLSTGVGMAGGLGGALREPGDLLSGTPPSGGLKRREWPRGPAGSCAVRAGR